MINLEIEASSAILWNTIAYLPNSVVRLSAASRKAVVSMALSLLAFTGTSTKDFLRVSNQVPPRGYVVFAAMIAVAAGFAVCAVRWWGSGLVHIIVDGRESR